MFAAAFDDAHRLAAVRRNRGVFTHELRVTQYAVERCAQLMADGADVAALGLVGLVCQLLGFLEVLLALQILVCVQLLSNLS